MALEESAEEEALWAHRALLEARSPVLRTMLSSGMREGKKDVDGRLELTLRDAESAVVRDLLHFLYTD